MSAGKQISQNFAVLSLGQVASKVLAFVVTIFIAKLLLPERFGAVVFASGTLLYATLLLDFGFEQYGPIEVGRGDIDIRKLAGNVISWRCLFLIPALALFLFVANLIPVPEFTRLVIQLYALSLFTNALDLGWAFLGTKQMWPSAASELITQLVIVVGAYLLIHGPEQALYMPILFTIGRTAAVGFLLVLFIKRYGSIKLGIDTAYIFSLIKRAAPLWGSQIMGMILTNFDLLLIGLWLGAAPVGVYGAATRLVWMPTTFAVAYNASLRPILSNSYVNGFHTVEHLFARMLRVSTALGAGVFVGAWLLAGPIMVQLFGQKYESGATALVLLAAAFFVMVVRINYRSVLQTYNLQVVDFKNICIAAVVSIIFDFCFIPTCGTAGAALGNVAAELVILILAYRATKSIITKQSILPHVLKTGVCCAAMALVVLATQPIGSVYIRAALAGLSYFAAMLATGIIRMSDLLSLASSVLPARRTTAPARTYVAPQPVPVAAEREREELVASRK